MGLSGTISEIDGDFSRELQIFSPPSILCPCSWGSPWNWISAQWAKKLEWWGYQMF